MMTKKSCLAPSSAWVEINLRALKHNFNQMRRLAFKQLEPRRGRSVDILSVVKADAYGHGMLEAASVFYSQGSSFFAVSNINEGILLRKHLPHKARIIVFEATLLELIPFFVQYHLTPALCSMDFARKFDAALGRLPCRKGGAALRPVHIKIDTGMGRMGVPHARAFEFIKAVSALKYLSLEGLLTHFPLADTDEAFTCAQMDSFSKVVSEAIKDGVSFSYLHAANSMGLSGYKNRLFNLARPGIMLYGLYPSDSVRDTIDLKPAMSVKSRVLLLKTIAAGSGVSYGHTFRALGDIPVAVVSIGYSDGYARAMSNRGAVLINGVRCPILGRVTMDQIVVDITLALKVARVSVGDEVVVMGRQGKGFISADELAAWAGTIHYEITCSLGNRLPRKFVA